MRRRLGSIPINRAEVVPTEDFLALARALQRAVPN